MLSTCFANNKNNTGDRYHFNGILFHRFEELRGTHLYTIQGSTMHFRALKIKFFSDGGQPDKCFEIVSSLTEYSSGQATCFKFFLG